MGTARRLGVPRNRFKLDQQQEMMEALHNHSPHVIVVDELTTADEARAVEAIVERGAMS